MSTKTPRKKTSTASRKQFKNVNELIYKLNGHLMEVNNIAGQIARDKNVYPLTRNNAKFLLKLLSKLKSNFWGPLTWHK